MLCDAGMDSFRFSLNSVREEFYNRYYRPVGYTFADVTASAKAAKERGRFTMINYLVSPGVNDAPEEVAALLEFIDTTGIDMIQMRNLSIDPDFYHQKLEVGEKGIGMYRMLEKVKRTFPRLQYGYFNRTKENFYPENLETSWPIKL